MSDTAPDLHLGLIGDNIARSRSPLLHRLAGAQNGMDVVYDRLIPATLKTDFEATFANCARHGFRGINVTYPYKERAARLVEIDDPLVRAIGAVNTVIFDTDGPKGHNTDYSGFVAAYQSLRGEALPGPTLMIGTGGVGRAVAFGLIALGVERLHLVDRDRQKAESLAQDLRDAAPAVQVTVFDDASAAAQEAQGLINCTPVGMVGLEGTPLPRAAMRGAHWAFDAVYTPVDTQFLQDAEAEGLQVISGWQLFFFQGVHAWKLFAARPLNEAQLMADLLADKDA
ncbi:Quinate/shikimate dehydrogenase [Aquimixticola soesokkakensis]|uniref:Quinate/shikimate dehydrogenase n=1 Tax=Aquimixticola soesokkakensis TaxID=1519096 RepID=A0A1Y5STK3_9RHOB|nr:shikimate dehydrogenase [Aquimixticola soesokkakensis]SLN48215.1 Quinate/shikimate dehydrogenase [Aquimixticola soesokkakensis]